MNNLRKSTTQETNRRQSEKLFHQILSRPDHNKENNFESKLRPHFHSHRQPTPRIFSYRTSSKKSTRQNERGALRLQHMPQPHRQSTLPGKIIRAHSLNIRYSQRRKCGESTHRKDYTKMLSDARQTLQRTVRQPQHTNSASRCKARTNAPATTSAASDSFLEGLPTPIRAL